eukprot:m.228991 g.228991  ORF g.228991 m.228991 type:complete len:483 (-) comp15200_c0_seq1:127-1575(-)
MLFGRVQCVLATLVVVALGTALAGRPNILLVVIDDVGAERFRFYDSNINRSPSINKLAKESLRIDGYFAQPLCGPSRAAMLSGRYASETGVTGNGHVDEPNFDEDECTLGSTFAAGGYDTLIAGKVHVSTKFAYNMTESCGFNGVHIWAREGPRYNDPVMLTNYGKGNLPVKKVLRAVKKGKRATPRSLTYPGAYAPFVNRDVIKAFMTFHARSEDPKPFFVYYPMIVCHGAGSNTTDADSLPVGETVPNTEEEVFNRRLELADGIIGDMLAHLDKLGLTDNTLVVVTSDNGSPRQYNAIVGGVEMSGAKKQPFQTAGTRVPMLMRLPGVLKPKRVIQNAMSVVDVMPTLMGAAEITSFAPGKKRGTGKNYWRVLKGKKEPAESFVFVFSENRSPAVVARSNRFIIGSDGVIHEELEWYHDVITSPAKVCQSRVRVKAVNKLMQHTRALGEPFILPGETEPVDYSTCNSLMCGRDAHVYCVE